MKSSEHQKVLAYLRQATAKCLKECEELRKQTDEFWKRNPRPEVKRTHGIMGRIQKHEK